MNILAPWKGSNAKLMRGKGHLFFTVMLFNPQKSIKGRKDLSFFSTKKNPALRGEDEGQMIPAARESVIYSSIASLSGRWLVGNGAQERRSMVQS